MNDKTPTPDPGPRRSRTEDPEPRTPSPDPRRNPGPNPEGNPDPDPKHTPGLEAGGGVPPGETPPAEGSTSEAGPQETHNPPRGWAVGPLIALILVSALVAAFFVGYAVVLLQ